VSRLTGVSSGKIVVAEPQIPRLILLAVLTSMASSSAAKIFPKLAQMSLLAGNMATGPHFFND